MLLRIKIIILLPIFSLIAIAMPAQNPGQKSGPTRGSANGGGQPFGIISGALHDETTKEHVEYASVLLYRAKDSTMVTGAISDTKGRFQLENIYPGKYYLKVRFIGYQDKIVPGISISQQSANLKLDDIYISPATSDLSGVVITANRNTVSTNLDRKVITVDKTMALSGGSAADVMENIPSVAVDAEGNVSLRGNQNITLLIDGKPASQAGISSSDVLNQMPASAIESIEIITNPSVRYDPDGTSGIINIVLKKKALQGFNGQISGTAGTHDKYNGSLNLNYRHEKFNLFTSIDGRYGLNKSAFESVRTSTIENVTNILRQSQDGSGKRKSMNYSAGIDYFLNSRNNFTLSWQQRDMNFGQEGTMIYKNYNANDTLLRYFDRYNNNERNVLSNTYTLSYKHSFAQKGREFTSDLIVNDNNMDNDQQTRQQNYDLVSLQKLGQSMMQHNIAKNINRFYTFQGNYIQPLKGDARLEAGYKTTWRTLEMDYDYNNFNNLTGEWVALDQLKNHYNYDEKLYAVYGIYGNSWKKLKYQGGLRFEQVFTQSKVKQTNTEYNENYTSFYPSLHLQYDLGKGREMQLSYSRRVDRPSPRDMNPYVDYSDSLNIRIGNPALKPEYTNSIELGLMKYWNKSSLSATSFFKNTTGMVENIRTLDANGVSTEIPQNINNSQSYGFEFVVTNNPAKWLRLNSNFSVYRYLVSAIPEQNIDGADRLSYSARVNASFNFSKDGALQLIANYMSPTNSVQEKRDGNFTMDASVRQDVFKNKLTLTLRATDIFNTRNFNSTTTGSNFTSVNKRHIESRVLYAGFQLRINNYSRKADKDRLNGDTQDIDGF